MVRPTNVYGGMLVSAIQEQMTRTLRGFRLPDFIVDMYRDDRERIFTFRAVEAQASAAARLGVQVQITYQAIYSFEGVYQVARYIAAHMTQLIIDTVNGRHLPDDRDTAPSLTSGCLSYTRSSSERLAEAKLVAEKKERNTTRIVRFRQGAKNEIDFTGHRATRVVKRRDDR